VVIDAHDARAVAELSALIFSSKAAAHGGGRLGGGARVPRASGDSPWHRAGLPRTDVLVRLDMAGARPVAVTVSALLAAAEMHAAQAKARAEGGSGDGAVVVHRRMGMFFIFFIFLFIFFFFPSFFLTNFF
jgi:hypothetical protein